MLRQPLTTSSRSKEYRCANASARVTPVDQRALIEQRPERPFLGGELSARRSDPPRNPIEERARQVSR